MADKGLVVPIEVTVNRIERQMVSIMKKMKDTAEAGQSAFEKANKNIGSSSQRGGNQVERTFKRSGFAVANLSAQLNDVGVSLAGGQSPFQVMIQQGTQITQIFQQSGGDAKQFFELLKGSIAGIINPFSLATFAIIGFSGAILQYFTTSTEAADTLKETLDELSGAISKLDKINKEAGKAFDETFEKSISTDAAIVKIRKLREELEELRTKELEKLNKSFDDIDFGELQLDGKFQLPLPAASFLAPITNLDSLNNVKQIADEFRRIAQEAFTAGDGIKEVRDEAAKLAVSDEVPEKMREVANEVLVATEEFEQLEAKINAATVAIGAFGDKASEAIKKASKQAVDEYRDALDKFKASQIDLEFKNDPVGGELAKASEAFDKAVGDVTGLDPIVQTIIEQEKQKVLDLTKATAENEKTLKEWEKANREAERRRNKTPKKTPEEKFDIRLDDRKRSIELIEAEADILAKFNPEMDNYVFLLAAAKEEQKLLNEAQKLGVEITPQLAAQIAELSAKYAESQQRLADMKLEQDKAVEAMKDLKETGKNALGTLLKDLRDGKRGAELFENALAQIEQKLLDIALNSIFDIDGGGNFLDALLKLLGGGGSGGKSSSKIPIPTPNPVKVQTNAEPIQQVLSGGNTQIVKLATDNISDLSKSVENMKSKIDNSSKGGEKFTQPAPVVKVFNNNANDTEASVSQDEEGLVLTINKIVKDEYASGGFDNINKSKYGIRKQRRRR